MASTNLITLLDLRRAAEEEAKRALAEAVSALGRAQAEQARRDDRVAEAERALAAEKRDRPADAAQGLARERFHQRLLAQRDQARTEARQHQEGALLRAQEAETAAAESLRQASLERQVAERLWQRQQAEQRKQDERRDEQQVEDWVQSTRHRPKP